MHLRNSCGRSAARVTHFMLKRSAPSRSQGFGIERFFEQFTRTAGKAAQGKHHTDQNNCVALLHGCLCLLDGKTLLPVNLRRQFQLVSPYYTIRQLVRNSCILTHDARASTLSNSQTALNQQKTMNRAVIIADWQ